MRSLLTIALLAATLHARSSMMAQTNAERAAMKAAVDTLMPPSSRVKVMVIAAPTECEPEGVGFNSAVDCQGRKFTASGRIRAAAATQNLATAVGGRVTENPLQEIRSLRTAGREVRPRYCSGVTEFVALLVPGPLVEVEPDARWRITLTLFTYPKQFECEGAGNVVEVEVARVGNAVRVISTTLKRHYSGLHLPPQ